MRKAIIHTCITQIATDCKVQPRSPLFFFKNDSWQPVLLNGKVLNVYGTFGISAVEFVAQDIIDGKLPTNTTQYEINFPASPDQQLYRQSLQLVEFLIEMKNEN